ncbi:TetR/AcrR family transcriptional regulator [Mycobacterium seoulense]|uniref:TetR/AcrR family transcriptional regulator n=1 Tax=Mycobacterium TaxID=1763 RepID=UPI0009ED3FB2|nr:MULTISPECIES: TetR/AcrR family transcriptional regulator [Mycobacterium]
MRGFSYTRAVTTKSRTRVPFAKSARTRARILDSAARVFSQNGYAGTRLTDIAEAAEVKQGSLYYYFDSKDTLVAEMLRVGLEKTHEHVVSAVEALGPEASATARLGAAIHAHAEAVIEAVDYTAANARILGQLPDELRKRHIRVDQRPYGKLWDGLLSDARDAGEIRDDLDLQTLRLLIMGSLNWTVEWPDRAKRSPEKVADLLISALFDGITIRDHAVQI